MLGLLLFVIYWITFLQKRYDTNLFIFFLLATSCYQCVPVSIMALKPIVGKPYDWISLIIILHLIFRFKSLQLKKYLTLPVRVYLGFLVCLALYSFFALHLEAKVIIAVFRLHLFLISPILFTVYDYSTIQKVIKWICFFTVVTSGIFILQAIKGKAILSSLQSDDVSSKEGVKGLMRFYNLPSFVLFAFAYYAKQIFTSFNIKTLAYITVVFLAILVSFNRNTLLVAILLLIAVYYHNKKLNLISLALFLLFGWLIALPFEQTGDKRYSGGLNDITSFGKAFNFRKIYDVDIDELSTTQYRALHFYERFDYVTHHGALTALTGVGLANDQSRLKKKLDFVTGVVKEDTDEIEQIDTGDIVWSLLILQVGLFGIALFVMIQLNYIKFFYKYKIFTFSYLSGIYVVALLITSFFGVDIFLPPVLVFVGMLYVLTYKGANTFISTIRNSTQKTELVQSLN